MKRTVLLLFVIVLSSLLSAQVQPLLEEGKSWTVYSRAYGDRSYYNITSYVNGDTVINGRTYKNIYSVRKEYDLESNAPIETSSPRIYKSDIMREENGVVYIYLRDKGKETVWFDYNMNVGDEFIMEYGSFNSDEYDYVKGVVTGITTVTGVDGVERKCRTLALFAVAGDVSQGWGEYLFIEGVGESKTGLGFSYCVECTGAAEEELLCVHDADGKHLFGSGDGCAAMGIGGMSTDDTHSATMYDLQGRPLKSAPQKGLFIQDGKKYFME